jgi:glycogen synthase
MRFLAIGIALAVVVWVVSGGHVFFLPLLFIPFGMFSLGHKRRRDRF